MSAAVAVGDISDSRALNASAAQRFGLHRVVDHCFMAVAPVENDSVLKNYHPDSSLIYWHFHLIVEKQVVGAYTVWMTTSPPVSFSTLTPDTVLDALDSIGLHGHGRLLALNSYENRVYQIGMEDGPPLVAKFYRPGRWSDAAILEEHGFVQELVEREIPVVAAWAAADGKTLHQFDGFSFAVFPRHGGRSPELEDDATLEWLGRSLWRIHAVGGLRVYQQRPTLELDIASFGEEPSVFRWPTASSRRICWRPIAVPLAKRCWACAVASSVASSVGALRLHGDCHGSNVLWTDARQHFVDFDDSRMGPGGTGSVDVVVQ